MSAPRVVGLDLSLTATGIAHADGQLETIGTGLRGMARLAYIVDEVLVAVEEVGTDRGLDTLDLVPVDLVAIEGYAFGRPNQAAHLGELGGAVRLALWARDIPYVDVPPSNVKKYATGRGNAPKPDIRMEVYKRFGHDIADDNQCDAFVLRAMCLDALGHPLATMPATHRVALDKVAWPNLGSAAA
jgi:Holliday junction resolvasome RuvABC endonuclease subunit